MSIELQFTEQRLSLIGASTLNGKKPLDNFFEVTSDLTNYLNVDTVQTN